MTKTKSTKRALLSSALALVLCVSMLVGSTYAWFTDSVTSAGNKIVAGTLDIQLLMKTTAEGEYVDISDETAPIFGAGSIAQNDNAETLWEPGKTQVAYLAIKNNGNLALKYTVGLNVQNVSKDLYKVMQYAVTPDAEFGEVTAWAGNGNGVVVGTQTVTDSDTVMNPGDVHYFALSIHMDEKAGNEYQGGEVNFDLTVLATQATVESDSFDNQYDKLADYDGEISNLVSLAAAMENDGTYKVVADITLSEPVTVESDVVLDLNDYTLTTTNTTDGLPIYLKSGKLTILNGTLALDGSAESAHGTYNSAIGYEAGTELVVDGVTFEGVTGINGTWQTDGAVKITVSNSTFGVSSTGIAVCTGSSDTVATITDCNIKATKYAVFGSQGSKITVNGGTYESAVAIYAQDAGTIVTVEGGTFTGALNAVNGGEIVIKGGTFSVDPSDYVADGYDVIDNGNGTYTVVEGTIVSDTAELQSALDSAEDGDTIRLVPGVSYGTVYMGRPTKNNDTTMTCNDGNTHSDTPYTTTNVEDFKAHLADGQWHTTPRYTTTLKDLTVIGAEGATIAGIVTTSGHAYGDVYDYVLDKDRDVGSAYYNTLNMENIVFSNVNFTGKIDIGTSDATSVYDGVTFDGCTFTTGGTASTNGPAIRYYNEANNGNVKNIKVNDCTFTNCYQGVYVHHVNGVTVTGCTFDTTGHNAIGIQGHDGAVDLKNVVITGNTFKNIGDRVIRFNEIGSDSNITIRNNTAVNSGDEGGEVMKATSIASGVKTSISNNTWNGVVVNEELKDN